MMPAPAFRILGVPVYVEPLFFVVAVLLGTGLAQRPVLLAVWVVVVLVSVLWHEMGHALAYRGFGFAPLIRLHAFGGETSAAGALSPRRDMVVSLAGPFAGLLVGGAVLALARPGGLDVDQPLSEAVAAQLVWTNVGWAVLNLLPVLPLDGGRVVASALRLATRGRGDVPAHVISAVVGAGGAVAAGAAGYWWTAALAAWFVVYNARQLVDAREDRSGLAPAERLAEGYEALGQGAMLAASNRAREVLGSDSSAEVRAQALGLLVWCQVLDDRLQEAADSMASLPGGGVTEPMLHPGVVAAAGSSDGIIDRLRQVFSAFPSDATGVWLSRALIEVGRLSEAVDLVMEDRSSGVGVNTYAVVGAGLYRAGRFQDAAQVGVRGFGLQADPTLAYNVACSWARADRLDEALNWLAKAVEAGYRDMDSVANAEDLTPLRNMPGFEAIQSRLRHAGS